jgi:hypothetical protein
MTPAWTTVALVMPLLAGIVAWEAAGPLDASQSPPAELPNVSVDQPYAIAAEAGRSQDWAAAILARPLFSPARRPFLDSARPARPAALPPRLAGVVVSPYGRRAIFAGTTADAKVVATGEGDRLGDYVVLDIAAEGVTVIGPDGADQVVTLAADPAGRAAGVAVVEATRVAENPRPHRPMLDLLRTIPGEVARLGPPGGPVPPQAAR